MSDIRHFRVYFKNGDMRDFRTETITDILMQLYNVGELAGVERFEQMNPLPYKTKKKGMKETRILSLNHDRYIVPNDMEIEDVKGILALVGRLRPCDYNGNPTGTMRTIEYTVKFEDIHGATEEDQP